MILLRILLTISVFFCLLTTIFAAVLHVYKSHNKLFNYLQ